MNEVIAPESYHRDGALSIFLAGTIDNGDSVDWQRELCDKLDEYDVKVFNPRRPDWNPDASKETIHEQINWELDALDEACLIIMYLAPGSKSPISLMELGLFAHKHIVVYCPDDFWRKDNVDVVCERFKLPVITDKDKFFDKIVEFVKTETIE